MKPTDTGSSAGPRACPACRHILGGGVAYCPFCGGDQLVQSRPSPASQPQPQPVARPRPPPPIEQPEAVLTPTPPTLPTAPSEPAARPARRPGRWAIGLLLAAALLYWLVAPHRTVLPGTLTVIVSPPVAGRVVVDDTPRGYPDEAISLPPGEHRVAVQAPGWTADQRTITIQAGAAFRLLLRPRPIPVTVSVSTEPAALLSIDGGGPRMAPVTLLLPAGLHHVRATADGYLPVVRTIVVSPDKAQSLTLTLRPAPPRAIPLFAAVGLWSRPVRLPPGTRFHLTSSGRLRLRLGRQVFLIEPGQAANLGEIDPGSLQVKAAQPTPFAVSLLIEQDSHAVAAPAAPATVPEEQVPSPDRRAAEFLQQEFRAWSTDNETAMAFERSAYAPQVKYYGAMTAMAVVLAHKQAFVERWPERRYTLRPDATRIACDGVFCHVEGIVDWFAASSLRNAHAAGTAAVELDLDLSSDQPLIVGENGHVMSRSN